MRIKLSPQDRRWLKSLFTRDGEGRHFTDVYPVEWLDNMEGAGLIIIEPSLDQRQRVHSAPLTWVVGVPLATYQLVDSQRDLADD
jgi:hypothetical protein